MFSHWRLQYPVKTKRLMKARLKHLLHQQQLKQPLSRLQPVLMPNSHSGFPEKCLFQLKMTRNLICGTI